MEAVPVTDLPAGADVLIILGVSFSHLGPLGYQPEVVVSFYLYYAEVNDKPEAECTKNENNIF